MGLFTNFYKYPKINYPYTPYVRVFISVANILGIANTQRIHWLTGDNGKFKYCTIYTIGDRFGVGVFVKLSSTAFIRVAS